VKVILRTDVDQVGRRGDLVDVSDGHARNHLLPKGLAIRATPSAQAQAARLPPIIRPIRAATTTVSAAASAPSTRVADGVAIWSASPKTATTSGGRSTKYSP
jgi:large subunit ribosomal protein L9